MKGPVVADNKPRKVSLHKGQEYYFCVCGRSASQPFCDGSHAGSGFEPKAFVVVGEDGVPHMLALKKGKQAVLRRGLEILPTDNGTPALAGEAPKRLGDGKPKK